MKILAIESSCDETAAAVVEDGRKVLSNVVASQVKEHIIYGGVVPEIASRMHAEAISGVVKQALDESETKIEDVDAIAVTYAPGLIGALLVGVNFAKGLAYSSKKPLVPVHHLRSHVASNYISHQELKPPFLALVVSGGHTHVIEVNDYTDYKVIGKTMDDAAGEVMDKAARTMGLSYPGGLNLDRVSVDGDPDAYKFPTPRVEGRPYDFSFSGLKTSVINTIHKAEQKGESYNVADLGASFINAVTNCLCQKVEMAANEFGHKKIVLAGGVSANSVLRNKIQKLCKENGWQLYLPELKYCGDNAAMVGSQGYFEMLSGHISDSSLNAYATMPIDNCTF